MDERGAIGFVGTGTIGAPMARRLIGAGHRLVVHDVRPEAMRPLEAAGAAPVPRPRDVAERCDIVFTSLPGPPEVEAVAMGDDGLLAGFAPGAVHVDLSTNALDAVRRLAEHCAERGVAFVDAPVSGGVFGAERGTLTVMASGDAAGFERARPFMEAFAQTFFFLGETGSGTLAKLVNNAIFLCSGLILQEAFVMAAKSGLDTAELLEVVKASSGAMYAGLAEPTFARERGPVFFKLAIASKDVSLAVESARTLGVRMPVTEAAARVYAHAVADGLGDEIFYATLESLERAADTRVPRLGDDARTEGTDDAIKEPRPG